MKRTSFEELLQQSTGVGTRAEIARQYMLIYEKSRLKRAPTILELGTQTGVSTNVLLQVCKERGGRVCSVDILDCSSVSQNPSRCFVQSDSRDKEGILPKAPFLGDGIDILLIDSLHKRDHTAQEIEAWYPLVRCGGLIFFDDVDPHIYRKHERKDNVWVEFDLEDTHRFLVEMFRSNPEHMSLEVHYGSSGLAIAQKRAAFGESLVIPKRRAYRTDSPYWRMRVWLQRLRSEFVRQNAQ